MMFEICVKTKNPDGKHAPLVGNLEHLPVIEFDYAFATEAWWWIDFGSCAKEKRWPRRQCDAESSKLQ